MGKSTRGGEIDNHLMEQPSHFYATVLSLALSGDQSGTSLWLAWSCVGLRVVHILVQSAINHIPIRLALSCVSSLVLACLAISAAVLAF